MDAAKKVRTAAKARLTIASNRLSKLTSASSREDFVLAQEHFQEKLKLFDEAQEAVEALIVDEDNLLKEIEEGESFREEKQSALAKAMNVTNENSKDSRSSISDDVSVSSTSHVSANLPKLTLPTFSGDLITWQSFYDSFISIIDLRKDLSDIDKFQYLLSSLKDEAKQCLQGLPLTSANYSVAKELLEGRFGRKEKIVQQHIQCLLNVSNRKGLWKLYDEIQVHVRSLASLGVKGDNYGLVLAPIILHQLPSDIRLEWARRCEGKEGDITALLDLLYAEIQYRESSKYDVNSKIENQKGTNINKPSAAALVSHKGSEKPKPRCVFCKADHWPDQCPDIKNLDYEKRLDKIKDLNLCFLCLGTNHKASHCFKQRVCYHCKGPHNQVLCRKLISETRETRPIENNDSIDVSSTLYTKTNNGSTIMQTKTVMASEEKQSLAYLKLAVDHNTQVLEAMLRTVQDIHCLNLKLDRRVGVIEAEISRINAQNETKSSNDCVKNEGKISEDLFKAMISFVNDANGKNEKKDINKSQIKATNANSYMPYVLSQMNKFEEDLNNPLSKISTEMTNMTKRIASIEEKMEDMKVECSSQSLCMEEIKENLPSKEHLSTVCKDLMKLTRQQIEHVNTNVLKNKHQLCENLKSTTKLVDASLKEIKDVHCEFDPGGRINKIVSDQSRSVVDQIVMEGQILREVMEEKRLRKRSTTCDFHITNFTELVGSGEQQFSHIWYIDQAQRYVNVIVYSYLALLFLFTENMFIFLNGVIYYIYSKPNVCSVDSNTM